MSDRPEVYGGFVLGPNGDPTNILVAMNGPDTYIANNQGQSEDQFWQQHNHYRAGGYDGGGTRRGYYNGPGS